MNAKTILLRINRIARPVVDAMRLNRVARPIWRILWRAGGREMVHAEQNGRTWWLDADVALRGKEQEIDTVLWLRSVVKHGDTVIDVGANVGQMTLELAHLVGPTGRVVAIEPGPGNLAVLREHVKRNGFGARVVIVEAACCREHGGRMNLSVQSGDRAAVGSGFFLRGIGLVDQPRNSTEVMDICVATVSLDGLVAQMDLRPKVIKIDVEGAELEVFRGARCVLRDFSPRIRFGFHPHAFPDPKQARKEILSILNAEGMDVPESKTLNNWKLEEYTAERIT